MVLVLKALTNSFTSYDGFQWDTTANGVTIAPDFDPDPARQQGGGGLYGFKEAVGDSQLANMNLEYTKQGHYANHDMDMNWLVLDVDETPIDTGGAVRFQSARTVFRTVRNDVGGGTRISAMAANYILTEHLKEQNPSGTPGYTGYILDRPMMNVTMNFAALPNSNESPYMNTGLDVVTISWHNSLTNNTSSFEYSFGQYAFILGDGVTIRAHLHGTNRPNGTMWSVGDHSSVAAHGQKSVVITGEFAEVDLALALGGKGSSASIGRFSTANTGTNSTVDADDYCYLRDSGGSRISDVHDHGLLGATYTCKDYCRVLLGYYSSVQAGNRCNISGLSNVTVECGIGCRVVIVGSTLGVMPDRPPSRVKAKRGTHVTYSPDDSNAQQTYDWMVGIGGVQEDVFYRIENGLLMDDDDNVVAFQDFDFNADVGTYPLTTSDATGPTSFFYDLDDNPTLRGTADIPIKKLLTNKWKDFFNGYGPKNGYGKFL